MSMTVKDAVEGDYGERKAIPATSPGRESEMAFDEVYASREIMQDFTTNPEDYNLAESDDFDGLIIFGEKGAVYVDDEGEYFGGSLDGAILYAERDKRESTMWEPENLLEGLDEVPARKRLDRRSER